MLIYTIQTLPELCAILSALFTKSKLKYDFDEDKMNTLTANAAPCEGFKTHRQILQRIPTKKEPTKRHKKKTMFAKICFCTFQISGKDME